MSKYSRIIIILMLGSLALATSLSFIFLDNHKNNFKTSIESLGSANAAQDTKNFPIIEKVNLTRQFNAWYQVKIGNVTVGLFSVSTDDLKTAFPLNYNLQFVSRIGSSPLLSMLSGEIIKDEQDQIKITQTLISKAQNGSFKEIKNEWVQKGDGNLILNKDFGAYLQGIIPAKISRSNDNLKIDDKTSLFFIEPKQNKSKITKVYLPIAGLNLQIDYFTLKYDDDGFLNSGRIPFDGGGDLLFNRIDQDKYLSYSKISSETLLDFGWFSSLNSMKKEFETLNKSLENCAYRSSLLNKNIIKYLPQSSYLTYRKVINMSYFCMHLNSELITKENESINKKTNIIASYIKNLLRENPQELPYSLAYSPDITLFYNETVSFLWPRIASLITQIALSELEYNFELSKARKSLVGIQLNISSLRPRSVVRAEIKLLDSPLNFIIDKNQNQNMSPNSIQNISQDKNSSYFINGQSFAKDDTLNFEEFCSTSKGKIGIDLGDAPQFAVNNGTVRGVWDLQTRIDLARQFAIQASLAKSCRDIYFKISNENSKALSKELELFKSETLSSEAELLLSNNIQKKLWILPGKYRIIITSLVTGSVLSAQEFTVSEDVNTLVTANVN